MFHVLQRIPGLSYVLKWFVICFFSLIAFIILIIAIKKKWLSSLSLGSGKLSMAVKAAEVEKQFQAGTFNKLLDDQIKKLDDELTNFAIKKAHELRRSFTRDLFSQIGCTSSRRALVSVLRFPIYERCRINNFKQELKPENIKWYVKRIIKDVKAEYEDFAIELTDAVCPIYKNSCAAIPLIDDVITNLEKRILEDWALPIRRKLIEICESKIALYRQYIDHFIEIGDSVRIKRTEYCIEKNKNYIVSLKRHPELDEI